MRFMVFQSNSVVFISRAKSEKWVKDAMFLFKIKDKSLPIHMSIVNGSKK